MAEKTTRINPEFIIGKGIDQESVDTFFEGDDYTILGPLDPQFEAIGVLLTNNRALIDELDSKRSQADGKLDSGSLELLHIICLIQNGEPQALVDLPPDHYICLADLSEDKKTEELVEKLMTKEQNRGIYLDGLEARDFWVDPETKKLFLIALDKLK